MYYLEAGYDKHNRLRNAVLLALAAHAALILGISFDGGNTPSYSPQIEVTLAVRPSNETPEETSHIAQANQEGSGELAEMEAVNSRHQDFPAEAPPPQQIPLGQTELKPQAVATSRAAQNALVKDQSDREQLTDLLEISPEVNRLNRELASLEAQFDQQTRTYAHMPRVRRLTSVSAKQAADAAYLLDWRRRLEAVGNKYYPEASIRYGLYGDLRLLVVIRQDGSLEDIRLLSSSGYAVLDEAALKIVRMAAPFAPFPPELRATTDKLEIIRTWQFQENQLSSD